MPNLIISIGGTGKSVALAYLKLAKLFGTPSDVMVFDMPFGREAIDRLLDEEGVPQESFITPWAGGSTALAGLTFDQVIGLSRGDIAQPVAQALFSKEELNTLVADGMNCRPIVGATIAMRKFWASDPDPQLDQVRQRVGQYSQVFLVGSLTGGTGAGVMPTLARWLTDVCRKDVHGIFFLRYMELGPGTGDGPSDAQMDANSYAALSFLKQVDPVTNPHASGPAPFKDYIVIGRPSGIPADKTSTSGSHPLQLLASTYILYFDELLRRTPAQQPGPFYLEITAGGLKESDLQPSRGFSLAHALYRQFWLSAVLKSFAKQKPDEAWDILVPPGSTSRLAWRAFRESVRQISIAYGGRASRKTVWEEMRKHFQKESENAEKRLAQFEAITAVDTNHLVYDIDWDWVRQQANGSKARARRAIKSVRPPNINTEVSIQESPVLAAKALCNDVFQRLGEVAGSIARGGTRQVRRSGGSVVFLPPGVHNPVGGVADIARSPLTNFDALLRQLQGAYEAVNMPEPQARRLQFKVALENAFETYRRNPSKSLWDSSDQLAQFTILLEGVIFGVLRLKLFDLQSFSIQSSVERRVLGVLVDGDGTVYGGTDPDTMFFPAPGAWRLLEGALQVLSKENENRRNTDSGNKSRILLQRFCASLTFVNKPLWLLVLEEYLRLYAPQAGPGVDDCQLGWKQVGPIQLRSVGNDVAPMFLPLHEDNFYRKASVALSGDFVPRDSQIVLKVGADEIGEISYPQTVRFGLSHILLGAGCLNVWSSPGSLPVGINYVGIRNQCQTIVNQTGCLAKNPADHPFNFPDIIRIPFQIDGFIAKYFLEGKNEDEGYGKRFLDALRGRGIQNAPALPDGQNPPNAVRERDHFFVDSGAVSYVEAYQGIRIGELSRLGQALWMVFTGDAKQVEKRQIFCDSSRNVVLEFNDQRFIPGKAIELRAPDQKMNAVDLRGLVYVINLVDADPLFKEAVNCWLGCFGLEPSSGKCSRMPLYLGGRKWWSSGSEYSH
jgi:hypothetical protein